QLVDQPRVLDRDDGLARETGEQRDLLVGERPHLLTVDADGADQYPFPEHRHREKCSRPGTLYKGDDIRIALLISGVLIQIGNMDRPFRGSHAPKWPQRAGTKRRLALPTLRKRRRGIIHCDHADCFILMKIQISKIGLTDACRVLQYCLKYW